MRDGVVLDIGGPEVGPELDRRRFIVLSAAAASVLAFRPEPALAVTATIDPVPGIFSIAPGPNFFSSEAEKAAFYATPGLDGIFISGNWGDIEPTQSNFSTSNLGTMFAPLVDMCTYGNPSHMRFALGIGAGVKAPGYLVTNVSEGLPTGVVPPSGGDPVRLPYAEIVAAIDGSNVGTFYMSFPFDNIYANQYIIMLRHVLDYVQSTMGTIPGTSITYISLLASIKLGLYTGADLEITIPSWNPQTNESQAATWLSAFVAANNQADTWQTTVTNAWTSFATTVESTVLDYGLNSVTLSAPMYNPKISFPMISSAGSVVNTNDFSAFAFGLMTAAASATGNPIQTIDTSLSITAASEKLQFSSNFTTTVNASNTANVPYLAFQTNAWGDNNTAASGTNADPATLVPGPDTTTFTDMIELGLMNPISGKAYPYAPYIELHFEDVPKWNGTGGEGGSTSNVIQTIHKAIFGY